MRLVAFILCLCLFAPVVNAAAVNARHSERAERAARGRQSDHTTAVTPRSSPAPERLSADERSELSGRAEEPGQEVVGGALSNQHLTYIVIALAAAVIVLIAK
jgi:hypothetical protein